MTVRRPLVRREESCRGRGSWKLDSGIRVCVRVGDRESGRQTGSISQGQGVCMAYG